MTLSLHSLLNTEAVPSTGWPEIDELAQELASLREQRQHAHREAERLRSHGLPEAAATDRRRRAEALRKGKDVSDTPHSDKAQAALADADRKVAAADEAITLAGADLVARCEAHEGRWGAELDQAEEQARREYVSALDAAQQARASLQHHRALRRWVAQTAQGEVRPLAHADPPVLHLQGLNGDPTPAAAVWAALASDAAGLPPARPVSTFGGVPGARQVGTVPTVG